MKLSRNLSIVLLIVVNIALDQITKVIVRTTMIKGKAVNVLDEYVQLIWVENKGAFLGMGSDLSEITKAIFLLILPVAVLGYVIYHIFKTKDLDRLSLIGFCCIIGGGIANVFDRVAFGQVTDFMFLQINDTLKTGIFNVADLSVTTGIIILIFGNFFSRKKGLPEAA